MSSKYDVVVVGAGNAGLCAAISAVENGAKKVLVLEAAPETDRGGNSYYTGGLFRFPYHSVEDIKKVMTDMSPAEEEALDVQPYTEDDFYTDLMRLGDYENDPDLCNHFVEQALPTMIWLREQGVRFGFFGRLGIRQNGKLRFRPGTVLSAIGGGVGLVNQLWEAAEKRGIEFSYETIAQELVTDGPAVCGVRCQKAGQDVVFYADAVVLASGGFEANAEMRARYLGPNWDRARVRGTRFNTGKGIEMALNVGAMPYGHWSGCHSVAWDANAPKYGDRKMVDLFSKHHYEFGIVVNRDGKRFMDEGYDFHTYTYARFGAEVLQQPGRVAYQIFDQKVTHLLGETYHAPMVTKAEADTIEELAEALEINPEGLRQTVEEFNAAVMEDKEFNPTVLDGKATRGIYPAKSNWALKLDAPPYLGFAVTCGITFTFGGLCINPKTAAVLREDGSPVPNLYAAGELVGGLFYGNYPSGSGLTAGAVFGRIAGASAARKVS